MNKEKMNKIQLYELKKKNPLAAVGLSLVITGAGHIYLKKVAEGLVLLFVQLFLWIFLLGWIMWIIAPILAYKEAKKYNNILRLELGLTEKDVSD